MAQALQEDSAAPWLYKTPEGKRVCICQLCNCGRHKCPHNNGDLLNMGEQPCRLTEYDEKFVPRQAEATKSFKPVQTAFQSTEPLQSNTTNRADFQKWDPVRTDATRPTPQYRAPDGPFQGLTTHRVDYTPKETQLQGSFRPPAAEYQPSGPFSDQTTNRTDFTRKEISPVQSMRPDYKAHTSNAPFDALTNYRAEYVPQQLEPTKAIRPLSSRHLSDAPFEGNTDYKENYRGYKAEPQQSFRPSNSPYVSSAPFDSNTVYRGDYIQKDHYQPCPVDLLYSGRLKEYHLVGDENGHRWYERVGLGSAQQREKNLPQKETTRSAVLTPIQL